MGWSELEIVKNEYNDEFKKMDETLLQLLKERKEVAKGKRLFPPTDLMEEWAEKFEMDIPEISWLMHELNDGSRPFYKPDGPGELIAVLQIMRKSTLGDFDYVITHSMQHEHASIITLEINYKEKDNENIGHIVPHLILQVSGPANFNVRKSGSHGGGGNTQMQFEVSPRLPDNLNNIHFALVPYASPMEFRPKEIILDKEVCFNNQ